MMPAGFDSLLRLALRRDRRLIVLWTIGNVLLFVSQGWSVDRLYTTQQEFDDAAAAMADNPALVAMTGPARALNTTGGQVAWQAGAFGVIVAGLMAMLIIGRHTRVEEESGRDELVRAGVVDRRSPVLAAAAVAAIANVVMGVGIAASLLAYGLPAAGSLSLGLGTALCGMLFGAFTLVAAQLFVTTRAVYALAGAFMAAAYAVRAVGDVTGGELSWLSPIGWAQAMRAYSGERWWPAWLFVVATAGLLIAALALFDARDAGAGTLTRSGPARRARRPPRSALGLAWRLERNAVAGWAVGMFIGGLAYGSVGDDVGDVVGSSDLSRDLLGAGSADLVDAFYATAALILALVCCGFAIAAVLRPGADESSGVADQLLATPLTRRRWGASTWAVALIGSVVLILAGGLGLGLGLALATGDSCHLPSLVGATAVQGAAVWCLAAVAALAYGVSRSSGPWVWGYFAYVLVVALFAEVLSLPDWAIALSPFEHLPAAPAEDVTALPILGVVAVSAVLMLGGLQLLRRRDLG